MVLIGTSQDRILEAVRRDPSNARLTAAATAAAEQMTISTVASTKSRIASRPTDTSSLASSLAITDYQSASFVLVCRNLKFTTHIVR